MGGEGEGQGEGWDNLETGQGADQERESGSKQHQDPISSFWTSLSPFLSSWQEIA